MPLLVRMGRTFLHSPVSLRWRAASSCLQRLRRALSALGLRFRSRLTQRRLQSAMGFASALFTVHGLAPALLEHCECAICNDVVDDATLCQQGHTCVRAAAVLCGKRRRRAFCYML
jgi:hypothetical protein